MEEVIFDGALLRPVFSPRMKTVLSVVGLITNSLAEANKCMKRRLAEESGAPTTLDDVMKQSGLKIPGLEEALARLMGDSEEAKAAASMLVNTPDPADLLRAFVAAPPPRARSPIVTPPPAPTTATPEVVYPAFRPDLAPPPRAQAEAPVLRPELAPGARPDVAYPAFRPDLTPPRAETEAPVLRPELAPGARPEPAPVPTFRPDPAPAPAPRPEVTRESVTSPLVALVSRRFEAQRREKTAYEQLVDGRLVTLERKFADLTQEWQGLKERLQAKNAALQPDAPAAAAAPPPDAPAAAAAPPPDAPAAVAADAPAAAAAPDTTNPPTGDSESQMPATASTAEVLEALTLIEEYATEFQAADERQLGRIAALERNIESMRAQIQQELVALEATPAHV